MNMRMPAIGCLALVALAALPADGRAQGAPPLGDEPRREPGAVVPGDVVRVTAPAEWTEPLEGRVVDVRSDTLWLEDGRASAGRTAVPLATITQLQVKREPSGRIGAVFGVLTGAVIGATAAGELAEDGTNLVRNLAVVGGATVGVLGGYWVGSTLDKTIAGPRWVQVPVGRLQAAAGPIPGSGFAVYLSYSFR